MTTNLALANLHSRDDKLAEIADGFIGHPKDDYYFVEAKDFAWLIAEVERLRTALREISLVDLSGDGGADLCLCNTFQAVAKEALRQRDP